MPSLESPDKPAQAPEALDLAQLGRTYTPPPELDASPEVSEMIAELPWWASRGLLYIIVSFVVCLTLWAALTPIDVVVIARGSIVPEGNVRPLQAFEAGTVRLVLVREGQQVTAGQAAVQLDDAELKIRQRRLKAELETAEVGLLTLRATNQSVSAILDAETRIAGLRNELSEVNLSLDRTTLRAPTSGVVTALSVRGPGGVVAPGQAVALIAPAGARLVAEALVPNDQAGLMKPGLHAKLLLDAYPHQRYGAIEGTIISISPDAVAAEGGTFYRATILPKQVKLNAGKVEATLKPGLALGAQIVTERRSALRVFLNPFEGSAQ